MGWNILPTQLMMGIVTLCCLVFTAMFLYDYLLGVRSDVLT